MDHNLVTQVGKLLAEPDDNADIADTTGSFTSKNAVCSPDVNSDHLDANTGEERNKLKSVIKYAGHWNSLGSDLEVEESQVKPTRPLINLEIETKVEDLLRPLKLDDRPLDGPQAYFALGVEVPPRYALGIPRDYMDAAVQAVPDLKSTEAQIEQGLPVNASTQYVYDLEEVQKGGPSKGAELPPDYKFAEQDYLERALDFNETFNLFADDYEKLAKEGEAAEVTPVEEFKSMDSLTNEEFCHNKVVVGVEWHPLKPGYLAVLYSSGSTGLLMTQKTTRALENYTFQRNLVLVWKLADTIEPTLVLSCHHKIKAIKWSPVDQNLLIGVCESGQVSVWDLTYEWKKAETKARPIVEGFLMNPKESAPLISPVAMSDPKSSHNGPATDVQWLTPYFRVNKGGKHDKVDSGYSKQFISCGEDGALLIWDLDEVPKSVEKLFKQDDTQEKSKYRLYNNLFAPVYKCHPQIPDAKKVMISRLAIVPFVVEYKNKDEGTLEPSNFGKGKNTPPDYTVWFCTLDAIVSSFQWKGFDFEKDEEIPSETADVIFHRDGYHDGPITSISPSPVQPDLVLTIGGRISAVWSTANPGNPVLTRRSEARLISGDWSSVRPLLFYLTREDGVIEVWDFLVRSDKAVLQQNLSGDPLTAVSLYTNPLDRNYQLLAVADFSNSVQLHTLPRRFTNILPNDLKQANEFVERHIDAQRRYDVWNTRYNDENKDHIQEGKLVVTEESQATMKKVSAETSKLQAAEEKKFAKKWKKTEMQSGNKEAERQFALLLREKNLNKEEIMQKQQPLLLLQQITDEKKEKFKAKISEQKTEFDKFMELSIANKERLADIGIDKEAIRQRAKEVMKRLNEARGKQTELAPKRELNENEREKVLKTAELRRKAVDFALLTLKGREERCKARLAHWKKCSPPPPPTACSSSATGNVASLAIQRDSIDKDSAH